MHRGGREEDGSLSAAYGTGKRIAVHAGSASQVRPLSYVASSSCVAEKRERERERERARARARARERERERARERESEKEGERVKQKERAREVSAIPSVSIFHSFFSCVCQSLAGKARASGQRHREEREKDSVRARESEQERESEREIARESDRQRDREKEIERER